MLTIAEIIRYTQPGIYAILMQMVETFIMQLEEDETPEFKAIKSLMEERRAVPL